MTPKERARKMIARFSGETHSALVAIDLIIEYVQNRDQGVIDFEYDEYLKEVRSELLKRNSITFEIKGSDLTGIISKQNNMDAK